MQTLLSEDGQRLLQAIYDHFNEYAVWPTYRALEIKFRNEMKLHEIVGKLDKQLAGFEELYREDAVCYLTLDGLARCKGTSGDIAAIVKTAAIFAKRCIEANGAASITSDEIKDALELTELEVNRVCEMYWRFGWNLRLVEA